ncbi:MAG: ribokinase [Gemmatimonadota bacterium]
MDRPFVLVVGSINEDLVVSADRLPRPGETVAGGVFQRFGGGKGANQAVAAAKIGADVVFVGAVGDDDLGGHAIDRLDARGIDVTGVARVEGTATGVALIVVDRNGENQIAVASGANAALDRKLVERALGRRALKSDGVVLSNLEIGDDAVLAAAETAAASGLTLILNPAPARAIPDPLWALGPILTPNEGEAEALTGLSDPARAANALIEKTGVPVVVTLGDAGALVVDGGGARRYSAIDVEPIDSTGAGDVFNGVLAARLAAGNALDDAVRWAIVGSGLAVTERGARKPIATPNAITSRLGEVRGPN